MTESDKKNFKALFDELAQVYNRSALSNGAMKIYFNALAEYSFEQIRAGCNKHLTTAGERFFPLPADVIRHMDGGKPTADEVIAAAKLADTPLGILCRIQIGTWDLNHQQDGYLRQRAHECLFQLDEWASRAQRAQYSDHEISIMLKHGVDPTARFFRGLAKPENPEAVMARAERIAGTKRHQFLIEKPHQPDSSEVA